LKYLIYFILFFLSLKNYPQSFAPAAGFEGSSAIHKDSLIFIDWANKATLYQSYKNIANPENGIVIMADPTNVLGKVEESSKTVSLGDGGSAVLSFSLPIVNGKGADFAVFENGFFQNETSENAFLELAFVEVSTNGIDFVRFPAISETQTNSQMGSFEFNNARCLYNLAGKYTQYYGTPFDLEDIKDITINTNIDINNINFVRIIDVVGSLDENYCNYDSLGNKINDPYPTEFDTGGFDLDAIGVIHNQSEAENKIVVFPNPVNNILNIKNCNNKKYRVRLYDICSQLMLDKIIKDERKSIDVTNLAEGVYLLEIDCEKKIYQQFIIIL